MSRRLTVDDVEAAVDAGLLLSAGGSGGSGIARNRKIGEAAVNSGLSLVHPDELPADALIVVSTGIGAPASGAPRVEPHHAVESARLLIERLGRPIASVMPAHVPGMNAWLVASSLGLPLLDAASNGRGHPTPRLGSMGLAEDLSAVIVQAGVGRGREGKPFTVLTSGDFLSTSQVLRSAAQENGGLIHACRGPLTTAYVAKYGAAGAISHQLALGHAMRDAGCDGPRRASAAEKFLSGDTLLAGRVAENTVSYDGAFDVGTVRIAGASGEIVLGVCNEFMCADRDGLRLYTFPDLIAVLDPPSGRALEISELKQGTDVIVIATDRTHLPMGAGVLDRDAYLEIEQALKADLAGFALRTSREPTAI